MLCGIPAYPGGSHSCGERNAVFGRQLFRRTVVLPKPSPRALQSQCRETGAKVLRQWRVEYEHLQELNGDRWAGTPYVFVRDDGSRMHPDSITAWLNRFSAQNDRPHIHPHAFRHTAASTMIANGVDLVTTAAELGHANANTTATIYAHQIAIARATAADVRAGVFAGRK